MGYKEMAVKTAMNYINSEKLFATSYLDVCFMPGISVTSGVILIINL
jgi:hypothetical protein